MNILEQEIEDVIFNAINDCPEELMKAGFPVKENYTYLRQPVIGNYGKADLIGYKILPKRFGSRSVYIDIIELKKDEVNVDTLLQAIRYAKGIIHLIDSDSSFDFYYRFILVGKSIDAECEFVYLPDFCDKFSFYTYSIDLRTGLRFTRRGSYSLTDPGTISKKYNLSDMAKFHIKNTYKPMGIVEDYDEDMPF